MVRMIDIAKKAGVSLGTVSAVLGGKENNIRVSKEKTDLINTIARELNYIPNFASKVLTRQASMSLGVLIDSEDSEVRFQQLAAIERQAERCGYRLIVAETHNNPQKQSLNYRTLLQYGVDAVICHVNSLPEDIPNPEKIVLYGAEAVPDFPTVYYDMNSGYGEAVALFKSEGRQNIALVIGDQKYESVRARKHAFLSLIPEGENLIYTMAPLKTSKTRDAMDKLIHDFIIPNKIDAIIMQNDTWALALLHELMYHGIKVPRDISIVGQDNLPFSQCCRPSLSTIDPNTDELSEAIIKLVLERLKNPQASPQSWGVATRLIQRETTLPIKLSSKTRS